MQLNFINTLPCSVNLQYSVAGNHNKSVTLDEVIRNNATDFLPALQNIEAEASLVGVSCGDLAVVNPTWKGSLGSAGDTHGYSVLVTLRGGNLVVSRLNEPTNLKKSIEGQPALGYLVVRATFELPVNPVFFLKKIAVS